MTATEIDKRIATVNEMIAVCAVIANEHEAAAKQAKRRLDSYDHEMDMLLSKKRALA